MACIIAAVALKPLIPAWLPRYAIFLFVLFNPMSFTGSVMAHVVREGIYPALTLLVIGSAAGFLLRLDRAVTMQLPWAAGLGLSLAALWLTREEGVWIVPPLLLLALFGTAEIVRDGRCIPGKLLPLFIPFIIWTVCVTGICMLNRVYYGIFTTTEMKSPDFLDAYGVPCAGEPGALGTHCSRSAGSAQPRL
ncbi:MAG: hypothetical protein MZW92_31105 [Comamonadaceae bacterium]|nr:hypothetical protein [Comamonadaceae bacterium]